MRYKYHTMADFLDLIETELISFAQNFAVGGPIMASPAWALNPAKGAIVGFTANPRPGSREKSPSSCGEMVHSPAPGTSGTTLCVGFTAMPSAVVMPCYRRFPWSYPSGHLPLFPTSIREKNFAACS